MLVHSGQRVEIGGWYLDAHRHPVFLRSGDPAPICPRFGPSAVMWRLVIPLPLPTPRR
ncbi:MAG: hypothetical protein HZA58_00645 [Acidimicrobiia bacterium]|nr:hypothetical protein [Acidimicrobiia bacterium]